MLVPLGPQAAQGEPAWGAAQRSGRSGLFHSGQGGGQKGRQQGWPRRRRAGAAAVRVPVDRALPAGGGGEGTAVWCGPSVGPHGSPEQCCNLCSLESSQVPTRKVPSVWLQGSQSRFRWLSLLGPGQGALCPSDITSGQISRREARPSQARARPACPEREEQGQALAGHLS